MSAVLPADRILKELASLWGQQGEQAKAEEGSGVLRACSLTLLVMADEGDDPAEVGETIAALMPEHPARAILVRMTGTSQQPLEQRVYAQCWKPFGQRRQICCEQIEIKASDAAMKGLPSIILPLAVADLPLIVWSRSERLLSMDEFGPIAAMASKIIVNSDQLGPDALRRVAGLLASGWIIGDLAWTRLTRWREMLAQVFENRENLSQLQDVRNVSVNFEGFGKGMSWYMGAWIVDALKSSGIDAALAVGQGSVPVSLQGPDFNLEMRRREDRLEVLFHGATQCASLPFVTDYLLMREELGILRHDPVFEKTVASAVKLAYANG